MPEVNPDWNPVTFKVLGVIFSTDVPEMVKIILETSEGKLQKELNV